MEASFNLIDEPWIPVTDHGRVSLKEIFTTPSFYMLGGNPVQKIAIMKLLLAIAQAAATPENESAWETLGACGLAEASLKYLERWHDRFFLYGHNPFLQMPAVKAAKILPFGAVLPEISTGNTTVLSQIQVERQLDDADKALLLLTQMGFALSGKKPDNSVVLSAGYTGKQNNKGKPASGRSGPSVAFFGLLHNFIVGESIQQTLWLNLLSHEQIRKISCYSEGLGSAPWECMPDGEDCGVARELKASLMGRLIPLCRFVLLSDQGLHLTEGIAHLNYKEGIADPTAAINYSGKEPKALWVNPTKRPWRELTALLGLLSQTEVKGFHSPQIGYGLERARDRTKSFALWSGGLRVSSNAGEQYTTGNDDFVESLISLQSEILGESWFSQLKTELQDLDGLASMLYGRINRYFQEQSVDGSKIAAQGTQIFWEYCERNFQQLVDHCDLSEQSAKVRQQLHQRFSGFVHDAFDLFCPKSTARQLELWARWRPNTRKYLTQGV